MAARRRGAPNTRGLLIPGVSFVLDRVLRKARRNQAGMRKTIRRRHIGAAGHSLGAVTSLAVLANSCCLDRRVNAALA